MANKIKNALDHIQADSAQKESTKQFLSENRRKRKHPFYRPAIWRVLAADNSRESELESGVEGCSGHMGHGCRHVSADMEIVSEAHDNGLSFGKYNAYLQLRQYDDTVTIEECQNMSMSEIEQLIRECRQRGGHHSETDEGAYDETEESDTSLDYGGCHHQERHRYRGGHHE